MAAAAATKKSQQPAQPAGAPVDPKFELTEKTGTYVLRLALPGFRKDDFRVQVDGASRLIVRGTRTGTAAPGFLYKVFQLPSAASIDDIAGRFEAGVLTLTVPKRASASTGTTGAAAPTSIEEIKRKQPGVAKESKPKEEEIAREDALKKKAIDEAAKKDQQKKQQEEEENKAARKQEQQKKEEDVKTKEPQAVAAAPPKKPEASTGGDKAKAAIVPETLAERVRRRGEEEHTDAAPMTAAKHAKTDGEKKATASWGGGWKERVQGELKVLTDMKWADGLVEMARNNKEVVVIGIAAFSLGLLVSHKLFRK